ncbi:MAG: MarR family winged helix-turn-helix transcriptional regulator [Acidimicrobiales bacterium]
MDDADGDQGLDALTGVLLLARELRRHVHDLMAEEQWAAHAGFRPPCMGVLAVVEERQPVSQRQISDQLGLDASDVVGVLDILEAAAMVERRRDPRDRRRHAVVLTELGAAAARRFAVLRVEATERALADLDHEERRLLVDLLDRANARWAPDRSGGVSARAEGG